jgi:hypothetical protein
MEEGSEMKLTRLNKAWNRIIYPAVCLLLSGCGSLFMINANTSPSQPYSQLVHQSAVASFQCDEDIISIASGGYFNGEFFDQSGKKRNEMLSQLFISMRHKPEASRIVYAYSGMTFYYYMYRIQILRFGMDLQNPYTEVRVEYANDTESPMGSKYCLFY